MYLHNLSTIKLFLLLPQHNTMGENSRKILSPSKANALIEVVKSHSPQCVSVCIISSVSRLHHAWLQWLCRTQDQAPVSDEIIW